MPEIRPMTKKLAPDPQPIQTSATCPVEGILHLNFGRMRYNWKTSRLSPKRSLTIRKQKMNKRERKEEAVRPNNSNILHPNKPPVQKPCMDYLKVKPVH